MTWRPFVTCHSSFIIRHSSFIIRRSSLALSRSLIIFNFSLLIFIFADRRLFRLWRLFVDVFPYLTMTNIQRGFNSRGGYVDSNATATIIGEMEFEFEEVAVQAGLK